MYKQSRTTVHNNIGFLPYIGWKTENCKRFVLLLLILVVCSQDKREDRDGLLSMGHHGNTTNPLTSG